MMTNKRIVINRESPPMTREQIQRWEVTHPRSTVSNDTSRAATVKDQKFMEHWERVKEFGRTHPSMLPRQARHARKNEEIVGLGSVVRRQPREKPIPRMNLHGEVIGNRAYGPVNRRAEMNEKARKRAEKALAR